MLKRLVAALLLSIVLPLPLEVGSEDLIDAVQSGGITHHCGKIVDGEFVYISGHTAERKAISTCTSEKVKEP